MIAITKSFIVIVLLFLSSGKNSFAQNIINKKIFISSGYDVRLQFGGEIRGSQFNPNGASNSFAYTIVGDHIILRSTIKNFQPISLNIDEGAKKRINKHMFVLVYKDSISFSEQYYDFSTKEQIEAAITSAKQENEQPQTQSQPSQPAPGSASSIKSVPGNQPGTQLSPADETERNFSDLKTRANRAYNEKKYDEALDLYQQALTWKPGDPFCNSQIESIKLLKKQATEIEVKNKQQQVVEESYKTTMDIGNGYLAIHEFDKAALAFQEALTLKPGDKEATRLLNNITGLRDAYNKKQEELEKNKVIEKQYKDTIDYANNAFEAGLLKIARQKYTNALKIKKNDPFAQQQIVIIDSLERRQQQELSQQKTDSINRQKTQKRIEDSINTQFRLLVGKSDAAGSKKDYTLAYTYIMQALDLKPGDDGALKKSAEIQDALTVIEKKEKYKMFVRIGDSLAYQAKDPDASLKWYDSAIALNPQEDQAKKQSNLANHLILQRDSIKMVKENIEALNRNFNEAMADYRKGDSARTGKRYGEAYEHYTLFLNKTDAFKKNDYSVAQTNYINEARGYIERLAPYKIKQADVNLVTAQYPNIDFTKPPPNQLFSAQRLDASKQVAYIKKEILPIPPRINIMNSVADNVRITCQSMNFKEKYIYLRFVVKNNDTSVFLTGPMMLSVAKKGGQVTQVLPLFISDFPVIVSTGEKQFVYVIPLMLLWKDETLVFEVSDRLNSRKISLHINDVIFNMERSHPL